MANYKIESIKYAETFVGTLDEAIARAMAIDAEYCPAYGVQVQDDAGDTVWDSEDDESDTLIEIAKLQRLRDREIVQAAR